MWNNKTVAVIFPVTDVKEQIKNVILEFDSTGFVDEIIVVDYASSEEIDKQIKKTRAQLVTVPSSKYSDLIESGMKSTKADLMIIADPDGTFEGRDLVKFLSYSDDFDIVFGSRTHVSLTHKKSGLTFSRRIANALLGKVISVLFLSPPLTDVSCAFRLINRKAWQKILRQSKLSSSLLIAEWILIAAKNHMRFIQIPVNFNSKPSKTITSQQSKPEIVIFLFIVGSWLNNLFVSHHSR